MAKVSRHMSLIVPQKLSTSSFSRHLTHGQRAVFSASAVSLSGHNRWSKIKHDKGAADAKKNKVRSSIAQELTLTSKLYGADPNLNPRLATLVANAKKAGFPKATMDAAIARGQGKSTTGAALETLTLEVVMPPTIGLIIDCESENKARTLMNLRYHIKRHGGTVSPCGYLFQRKGRLVLDNQEKKLGVDDVLFEIIEAGADDVELDGDEDIVVWTEPSKTFSTAKELQKSLSMKLKSSEIIWDANKDTIVDIDDSNVVKTNHLIDLLKALQEDPEVQGVFANVAQGDISDERWNLLQANLDA
ncbi:hypothetical protein K3495_g7408 [Podosphaera aphanis]|nr:hypothetical protein K3495_g7408 [Podosphaera aphanis]